MALWPRTLLTGARFRRAFAGAGLYYGAWVVEAFGWFLFLPFLTRSFSVEDFGRYALLYSAAPFLLALSDLGMGSALVRYLSDEKNPEKRAALLMTAMTFRLTVSGGLGLLLTALSFWVEPLLAAPLRAFAGLSVIWALYQTTAESLRAHERHRATATMTLLVSLVAYPLRFLWVVFQDKGLVHLIAAHATGIAVALVFGAVILREKLSGSAATQELRRLFSFGGFAACAVLMRHARLLDRHVVRHLSSLRGAGLFQIAGTPAAAIEMVEQMGRLAMEPYLYGAAPEDRGTVLERFFGIGAFLMFGAAAAGSLLAPEIMAVLAPPEYAAAVGAITWYCFAGSLRAVTRIVELQAGIGGHTRLWAMGSATDLLTCAVLLLLLVPRWDVTGAGVAHLGAAILSLWVTSLLVRQVSVGRLPVSRFLALALCGALVCGWMVRGGVAGAAFPLWQRLLAGVTLVLVVGWRVLPRSLWPATAT